jgi:hypothetical protein
MDNSQALTALIEHVSASDMPVSLGWDEVQTWREGVLERFLAAGLLRKDVNAKALVCKGCEHHCFMQVVLSDDNKRAFIVCDVPGMQEQMGRINLPLERLKQWQASARQFALVLSRLLKLDFNPSQQKTSAAYKLGMLPSDGGRRWVSLARQPLAVEINRHQRPLAELLYFSDNELLIDEPLFNELLNSSSADAGKAITPDMSRQEERKLATQAMHQDWKDKYLELKRMHPGKPDTWYSMKISRLDIAQGRDSETIRKNMKR